MAAGNKEKEDSSSGSSETSDTDQKVKPAAKKPEPIIKTVTSIWTWIFVSAAFVLLLGSIGFSIYIYLVSCHGNVLKKKL